MKIEYTYKNIVLVMTKFIIRTTRNMFAVVNFFSYQTPCQNAPLISVIGRASLVFILLDVTRFTVLLPRLVQ